VTGSGRRHHRLSLELAHAVLLVRRMDVMLDFYTRVLGFEVTDRGPSRRPGCELVFVSSSPEWHHQLAFVDARVDPGLSNTVDHLAFRAHGGLPELRELVAVLRARDDVTDLNLVTHGNTWSVYLRDPEGNRLEVYVATPWHVAQPQGVAFDLDEGDDTVVARTADAFGSEPSFEPLERYQARRRAAAGLASERADGEP
jgi:catechol-2,3-dioxygenase